MIFRAALIGTLLLGATTPPEPGESAVEPSREELMLQLRDGTVKERKQATIRLVDSGDPSVLPLARTILADPSEEIRPKYRRALIYRILNRFPEEGEEFVLGLLDDENEMVRLTAAYNLGYVTDPRVGKKLGELLRSSSPQLQTAARMSMVVRSKATLAGLQSRVTGNPEPKAVPEEAMARVEADRRMLLGMLTDGSHLSEEYFRSLADIADHDTSREVLAIYTKSLPRKERESGRLLEQMARANRHWLGRATSAVDKPVAYTLKIHRPEAGQEAVEVPYRYDATDLMLARFAEQHLDRGTILDFTIDHLLLIPQLMRPRVEEADQDAEVVRLRYDLPSFVLLRTGLGVPGFSYWTGIPDAAREGIVTIDRKRAVPLGTELFDGAGKRVARVDFEDYRELADGSWAPLNIDIQVERLRFGDQIKRMQYQFSYGIETGAWLLTRAHAVELTSDGKVDRGLVETADRRLIEQDG